MSGHSSKKNFLLKPLLAALFSSSLVTAAAFAQTEIRANPTRPSASDNAYLAAVGYTELEFGFFIDANDWAAPAFLKFAVHPRFELGLHLSGVLSNINGTTKIGSPGGQAKYQIIQQPRAALALAGRIDFPESADPAYTLYAVSSLQFTQVQIDLTVGGARFDSGGGDYNSLFLYAIAVSPKLAGRLGGYVELFGQHTPNSDAFSTDAGLSFAHSPRLISDISIIVGLTSEVPDWTVQVGLTATLFKLF